MPLPVTEVMVPLAVPVPTTVKSLASTPVTLSEKVTAYCSLTALFGVLPTKAMADMLGATLSVMVSAAVSVAEEKAVVVPPPPVATLVPCWPAVLPLWSQARKVTALANVPLKLPSFLKYRRSVGRNSRALPLSLTLPTVDQLVPLSVE